MEHFALAQAATNFTSLLNAVIQETFSCDNSSEEALEHKQKVLHILMARHSFLKSLKKQAKQAAKVPAKSAVAQALAASDNPLLQKLASYKSVDSLPSENSLFCDYNTVLLNALEETGGKRSPAWYESLVEEDIGSFFADFCGHSVIVPLAMQPYYFSFLHAKLELGSEILLNNSSLFARLPVPSLCIELPADNPKLIDGEGGRITGLVMARQPMFYEKGKVNFEPFCQALPNSKIYYDSLAVMFCIDNKELLTLGHVFLDNDLTIDEVLLSGFLGIEVGLEDFSEEQLAKQKAEVLESEEAPFSPALFEAIREAFKYAAYTVVHAQRDEVKEPELLTNFEISDKLLSALAQPKKFECQSFE